MSIAQLNNDLLLERITYEVPHEAPAPIPWPAGLAPVATAYDRAAAQPLPSCDVLVVTWTVAEAQALKAQARWANQIYKRYGYWTSVGSAIATWAVIANLN